MDGDQPVQLSQGPAPRARQAEAPVNTIVAASRVAQDALDRDGLHPALDNNLRKRLTTPLGRSIAIRVPRRARRCVAALFWVSSGAFMAFALLTPLAYVHWIAWVGRPRDVVGFAVIAGVIGFVYGGMCFRAVHSRAFRVHVQRRHGRCCRSVADCVEASSSDLVCQLVEQSYFRKRRNLGPLAFAVSAAASLAAYGVIVYIVGDAQLRVAATAGSHVRRGAMLEEASVWFRSERQPSEHIANLTATDVTGAYFSDGVVDVSRTMPFCYTYTGQDAGVWCASWATAAPVVATMPRSDGQTVTLAAVCVGMPHPTIDPSYVDSPPPGQPLSPPGADECVASVQGVCGVTTSLVYGGAGLNGNPLAAILKHPDADFPPTLRAPGPPTMLCHPPHQVAEHWRAEAGRAELAYVLWAIIGPLGFVLPRLVAHILREWACCGSPWDTRSDTLFELGATGTCFNPSTALPHIRRHYDQRLRTDVYYQVFHRFFVRETGQ